MIAFFIGSHGKDPTAVWRDDRPFITAFPKLKDAPARYFIKSVVRCSDLDACGARLPRFVFGRHGKTFIGLFYALAVGAWSLGGWLLEMSPPYAIGMLVIAVHLGWQTRRIDLARPDVNYRLFLANILTGVLLACTAFSGTW